MQMAIEIELRFFDPERSTQVEGAGGKPLANGRNRWQTISEDRVDLLVRVARRHGRRIEQDQTAHMQVCGRGLAIQKCCVKPGQLLHRHLLSALRNAPLPYFRNTVA